MTSALLFCCGLSLDDVVLINTDKIDWMRPRTIVEAAYLFVYRLLRLLFKVAAPEIMMRQILALAVLQLSHEAVLPAIKWAWRQLGLKSGEGEEVIKLRGAMEAAKTYEEWREAHRALELLVRPKDTHDVVHSDRIQRMIAKTTLYGEFVKRQDVAQLQYRLRGELLRKHWGIGGADDAVLKENPEARLALHQYMDVVVDSIALIARGRADEEELELAERIDALRVRTNFFAETLHSFGRSALLLSGGARLGLMHLGVVRALRDQKLLPRVISGASAGSIVAAMLGAFTDAELNEKLFNPANLNLRFFAVVGEDQRANQTAEERASQYGTIMQSLMLLLPPPLPSLVEAVSQVFPLWFNSGTLLDVKVLAAAIRAATGDLTFQEAFERTGRIINITVSPTGDQDFPLLLNYLCSPRVLLWSASVASSAIPGVFGSVELLAKDMDGNIVPYYPEGLRWSDGSVENDLPMARIAELFNVNHFIVSQVNPHARLLAPMQTGPRLVADRGPARNAVNDALYAVEATTKVVVDFCRDQVRSSFKHFAAAFMIASPIFPFFAPLRSMGKALVPVLTQKYTGDITIMPAFTLHRVLNIMTNPSNDDYLEDIMAGERTTWPHMSRIRLHVAIELILDDARQSCRRQLARLEERLIGQQQQQQQSRQSPRASSLTASDSPAAAPPGTTERRRMAAAPLPTASVLNLSELDVGAPGSGPSGRAVRLPAHASETNGGGTGRPFTRMRSGSGFGALARSTSFADLNAKLKNRVLSFADFAEMANNQSVTSEDASAAASSEGEPAALPRQSSSSLLWPRSPRSARPVPTLDSTADDEHKMEELD